MSAELVFDTLAIIWLDIVLSGDNALVIGLAAATLAPHLRKKAVLFGMILATVIRIAFAVVATYLIQYPWLKFVGGLALLWVTWKLFVELRNPQHLQHDDDSISEEAGGASDRRSLMKALGTIIIADVSMSIDNVLAVASIADDNRILLVFGLVLSIMLMAFFATVIMRLLEKHPWISWIGVVLLLVIGIQMIWESWPYMVGLISGSSG